MKQLKIQILMHVPFEGPGCIAEWIDQHGHSVSYTHVYKSTHFPSPDDIDWVILMGGPMSVYEENEYEWLVAEKAFVRQAIAAGKVVIGICLGSQMIASALGAKVYPNHKKEIGWFDLKKTDAGKACSLLKDINDIFPVFHWHGDTFDIPEGAKGIFYSDTTPNQAYLLNGKVLGLQFHFEATADSIGDMIDNGMDELIPSATIQSADTIRKNTQNIAFNNKIMFGILDKLALV